jgi:hypothetical protein
MAQATPPRAVADAELVAFRVGHEHPGGAELGLGRGRQTGCAEGFEAGSFGFDVGPRLRPWKQSTSRTRCCNQPARSDAVSHHAQQHLIKRSTHETPGQPTWGFHLPHGAKLDMLRSQMLYPLSYERLR